MLAKLVLWAVNNARFSQEDRALFTGSLLHKFGAVDLHGIFSVGEGKILVRGTPLSHEQVISVRESAIAMKNSVARKLVREQVLSEAMNIGFTTAKNFEQTEFARAAVWFGTREEELYMLLAGQVEQELSL